MDNLQISKLVAELKIGCTTLILATSHLAAESPVFPHDIVTNKPAQLSLITVCK